ncbi:hypothetical protein [Paramagnetospirillum magnetotacticum]|uniref:hypothetical protein n=1 Tax=Paramagnetospirillum magnetotacticum TaxID=188 RepID=UPI0000383EDB|nr:hypothetical protein [Paramagnetospirillum magnetotacticum]
MPVYRALQNCRHGDRRFVAGQMVDFDGPPPDRFWVPVEASTDDVQTFQAAGKPASMDFMGAMALLKAKGITSP